MGVFSAYENVEGRTVSEIRDSSEVRPVGSLKSP